MKTDLTPTHRRTTSCQRGRAEGGGAEGRSGSEWRWRWIGWSCAVTYTHEQQTNMGEPPARFPEPVGSWVWWVSRAARILPASRKSPISAAAPIPAVCAVVAVEESAKNVSAESWVGSRSRADTRFPQVRSVRVVLITRLAQCFYLRCPCRVFPQCRRRLFPYFRHAHCHTTRSERSSEHTKHGNCRSVVQAESCTRP